MPQFSKRARAQSLFAPRRAPSVLTLLAILCRAGPGWAWRGSQPICEASLDSHTTSQDQAGPGSARKDRLASAAHLSTLSRGVCLQHTDEEAGGDETTVHGDHRRQPQVNG